MTRLEWGPGPDDHRVVCGAMTAPLPLGDALARVDRLRAELDVPVQPLRADRVVSMLHVEMAAWHAARSTRDHRARSDDPAVEFLLYVAADRQIRRALDAFGFRDQAGGLFLFVALGPVDPDVLCGAVSEALKVEAVPWPGAAGAWQRAGAEAQHWWADRLGLPPARSVGTVEDAVLAAMADLAVARL